MVLEKIKKFKNLRSVYLTKIIKFAMIFAILISGQRYVGILFSKSQSMPYRAFFFCKSTNIQFHDLVVFKHDTHGYVSDWLLTKQVVGMPGDKVIHEENAIKLNDHYLSTKSVSVTGKPLTKNGIEMIPEGYLFVAGTHPDSFDSRYKEFGLVPIAAIKGKAFVLW